MCRLADVRSFTFVVAKALVTDIEKMRKSSPNGQLQANDILNYFCGGQNVYTPYHIGYGLCQLKLNCCEYDYDGCKGPGWHGSKLVSYR